MKKIILLAFIFCAAKNTGAQNVGIGTNTPLRSLHMNNGSLLITGDTGTIPNLGTGSKLFWSPAKSAFRAGITTGTQWNYATLGTSSFAFGKNSNASDSFSMAGGEGNSVSGKHSFGMGLNLNVSGQYAAAFGKGNAVNGSYSFSSGMNNVVNGQYATAFGNNLNAPYSSLVIGRYNELGGSSTEWVSTDPAFVIGSGIQIFNSFFRYNVFSVAKNGNMKMAGNADIEGKAIINDSLKVTGTADITGNAKIGENMEVTGATTLRGLLKLNQKLVNVTTCEPFTLTVGNASYIKLVSTPCNILLTPSVTLSDGLEYGQLLIIVVSSSSIFFRDNQANNMALTSDHTLRTGSTITFIWTGAIWNQIAVSDVN